MNIREMEKLIAHFNYYFEQSDCTVLHSEESQPHIDLLLYKPTEKYPFWKLVTMGASDIKMNAPKNALGDRNEYMMMINPDIDMTDSAIAQWYFNQLTEVALYPLREQIFLSCGHSMEWEALDGEEMVGAYLDFPQVIENPGILRCKLGWLKTSICLLVVLLTRTEVDVLLKKGSESFSSFLFSSDGSKPHFLCEKTRTDKF